MMRIYFGKTFKYCVLSSFQSKIIPFLAIWDYTRRFRWETRASVHRFSNKVHPCELRKTRKYRMRARARKNVRVCQRMQKRKTGDREIERERETEKSETQRTKWWAAENESVLTSISMSILNVMWKYQEKDKVNNEINGERKATSTMDNYSLLATAGSFILEQ